MAGCIRTLYAENGYIKGEIKMFRVDLLKNKIYGILIILLGVVSVWACDGDCSFLVFALMLGIGLFFNKVPFDHDYLEDSDE